MELICFFTDLGPPSTDLELVTDLGHQVLTWSWSLTMDNKHWFELEQNWVVTELNHQALTWSWSLTLGTKH